MKVKSSMLVGNRVHVVKNGKNEYDGVILPGFTYSYGRDEFRFRIKTDQAVAEEDEDFPSPDDTEWHILHTNSKECTVITGGEHEIYVPDQLKDDSVLEWEYNGRRILNTAQTMTCRIEPNGMCTRTTLADSEAVVYDTELPEGFPEIKMTGHYVIEAKVMTRGDGKQYLTEFDIADRDYNAELTKEFTSLIYNFTEKYVAGGRINSMAQLIPQLPVDLDYDKITFYVPEYNVKLGDSIQFSHNDQTYDTVVCCMVHRIATSKNPAMVTLKLWDKATDKRAFNITKGIYKVIEIPRQSGLGSMNLF